MTRLQRLANRLLQDAQVLRERAEYLDTWAVGLALREDEWTPEQVNAVCAELERALPPEFS